VSDLILLTPNGIVALSQEDSNFVLLECAKCGEALLWKEAFQDSKPVNKCPLCGAEADDA
jgi:predicted RNA-binding Zn-ribbon protein involved in translation (DUF1610 family)